MDAGKKIAIVGDALVVPAGTEKVTLFLSDIFPDAPIYTSVYLPENTYPEFKRKKIITMPLASSVKNERQFKRFFPWWYLNFSLLDLSEFDIIISSSSYLAKYINPPRNVPHICCLQNPFRLLWKPSEYGQQSSPYGRTIMSVIKLLLPLARKVDVERTRRIRHVLANSQNMANQIRQAYGIEPEVVYPPIDMDRFSGTGTPGDYYLYAGRLISHKRVDLAIQACNQLKRKLVVAGDGPERKVLENLGGRTVEFVGRISDIRLKQLYADCRALLFPSDEDFGIVPVEAQASGRPVIAFRSGGALETVIENRTGIFFDHQDVEDVCAAILRFEKMEFDPALIRENARRFDRAIFEDKIRACVERFE
jgi:glycosyltransferase involved in cell wall biosynthesis